MYVCSVLTEGCIVMRKSRFDDFCGLRHIGVL
jgi:hypothetical protein